MGTRRLGMEALSVGFLKAHPEAIPHGTVEITGEHWASIRATTEALRSFVAANATVDAAWKWDHQVFWKVESAAVSKVHGKSNPAGDEARPPVDVRPSPQSQATAPPLPSGPQPSP